MCLFSLCCTADQSASLHVLRLALSCAGCLVSLTAGRGRGKSAVLGLGVALALCTEGARTVQVTAPHLENVQALFAFLGKGLQAAGWKEDEDYQVVVQGESGLVHRITGRRHICVVFLPPTERPSTGADLVVVDEAAALPLPLVREWVGKGGATFMASTIHGYEGTGRSLSLKLLAELRNPSNRSLTGSSLEEVELREAVRYAEGDPVEAWLERLLCLEDMQGGSRLEGELPPPNACTLYRVDRCGLFSSSPGAERFLRSLVGLFVTSHYRNSPGDLLLMADAPAHTLFCLMADPLCHPFVALQVSLEGGISREFAHREKALGKRGSGDLLPWILSQQFQDQDFPSLRGARIVRIATHPECQGMGYGKRALHLLSEFYSRPEKAFLPPLSRPLLEDCGGGGGGKLDYLGVSYGLTPELFRFWKNTGFVPLYIRQTTSEVTGEHTCVMVKSNAPWLQDYSSDFRLRFCSLLPSSFRHLSASMAQTILKGGACATLEAAEASFVLSFPTSLLRLSAYCKGEVDFHLLLDLMPRLAPLLLMGRIPSKPHPQQMCVLLSLGLQSKSVECVAQELQLDPSQVLVLFRRAMRTILEDLQEILGGNYCTTKGSSSQISSLERQEDEETCHKRKRHKANKKKSICQRTFL